MRRWFGLSVFLMLWGCAPEVPRGVTETLAGGPEVFVPVGGEASADDVARFLAGRPVRSGEGLSRLQQSGVYQDHAASMALKWRVGASRRTGLQRGWSEARLRPLIGDPKVLVYPFGGPDLLHAVALFPQASNYVLLGLEPAGGLPDLGAADPIQVMEGLRRLDEATDTQLKHGYFITKDMKGDLSQGVMPGVTPILLSSLALMDATVLSVDSISAAGRSGVDLRFRLPGGGSRRAIYLSGDLSNRGWSAADREWLDRFGGGVAYFKAASYLMHDDGFSGVRQWVLERCSAVVEDDSGIPFRYFGEGWEVYRFGTYESPIPLFAKHLQMDLRAAYAQGSLGALPFGSGYHLTADQANLLVAKKRR